MGRAGPWWRRHYGASPWHLLCVLACFAVAGYAVQRMATVPERARILVWFAGAVMVHDLVLWPLSTLVDRAVTRLVGGARDGPGRRPRVAVVNYLRVPAVISAILLAASFPLVFHLSEPTYHAATGLNEDPYLARWVAITVVLFVASGVLYAVRWLRARRAATPPTCPEPPGASR